jgi:hypothetical protein
MSHKLINAQGFRLGYTSYWFLRQIPLNYVSDCFFYYFYWNRLNLMFMNLSIFFVNFFNILNKNLLLEKRKKLYFLKILYFCFFKKQTFLHYYFYKFGKNKFYIKFFFFFQELNFLKNPNYLYDLCFLQNYYFVNQSLYLYNSLCYSEINFTALIRYLIYLRTYFLHFKWYASKQLSFTNSDFRNYKESYNNQQKASLPVLIFGYQTFLLKLNRFSFFFSKNYLNIKLFVSKIRNHNVNFLFFFVKKFSSNFFEILLKKKKKKFFFFFFFFLKDLFIKTRIFFHTLNFYKCLILVIFLEMNILCLLIFHQCFLFRYL